MLQLQFYLHSPGRLTGRPVFSWFQHGRPPAIASGARGRQCAIAPTHGSAKDPKTDLCHPATVAEGQGHARDKIARYFGVGRTTIEWAEAVVEEINPTNGIPVVQVLVLRFLAGSQQASFRLRVALAVFAASLRFLAEALAFLVAAALTAASLRFFAAALAFLVAAALFAEALRFRVAAALFAAALRSVAFFMARSIAERQQPMRGSTPGCAASTPTRSGREPERRAASPECGSTRVRCATTPHAT